MIDTKVHTVLQQYYILLQMLDFSQENNNLHESESEFDKSWCMWLVPQIWLVLSADLQVQWASAKILKI